MPPGAARRTRHRSRPQRGRPGGIPGQLTSPALRVLIGAAVYREPAGRNALLFQIGQPGTAVVPARYEPAPVGCSPGVAGPGLADPGVADGPIPPFHAPAGLADLIFECEQAGLLVVYRLVTRTGPAGTDIPPLFVDRQIANALHHDLAAALRSDEIITAHRRAAEYWQWRAAAWPQDRHADLHDLLEARYHLREAGDGGQAGAITEVVCAQLHAWGELDHEAALVQETLTWLPPDSPLRAGWIHEIGKIAQTRGNLIEAERRYQQSLEMFANAGDAAAASRSQHRLGVLAQARGDYAEAEHRYQQSRDLTGEQASAGPGRTGWPAESPGWANAAEWRRDSDLAGEASEADWTQGGERAGDADWTQVAGRAGGAGRAGEAERAGEPSRTREAGPTRDASWTGDAERVNRERLDAFPPGSALPDTWLPGDKVPGGAVPGYRLPRLGMLCLLSSILAIATGLVGLSAAGIIRIPPPNARGVPAGGAGGRPATAAVVRRQAAGWLTRQVSRSAIVSCDPAMCAALRAVGMPAANLLTLGPSAEDPLGSDVVVATTAVRSLFGSRLAGVYAPAVVAAFGLGKTRIQIRVVAPDGAVAYRNALRTDLLARRAAGTQLVHNKEISIGHAARKQLAAGQVDARLLTTIAALAHQQGLRIAGFSDSGPGAAPGTPLRLADISAPRAAASPAPAGRATAGPADARFIRSALLFLRAQRPPYLAAVLRTVTVGGRRAVQVSFAGPSPLGLLTAGAGHTDASP
jgi:tetratricopeptide (TPR) repeat protein